MTLSKKAACNSHGQDSSYFLGWQEYEKNPYDVVANPNGIIQMGLAENQVCVYIYREWFEFSLNQISFFSYINEIFTVPAALLRPTRVVARCESRCSRLQERRRVDFQRARSLSRLSRPSRFQECEHAIITHSISFFFFFFLVFFIN